MCLLAAVAVCNAGIANYNGAAVIAPTITSESQNVLRSYNGGQVAYQSKTIDTPYSSVSKSDVRVSNPGYAVHQPAVAYGEIIDNSLKNEILFYRSVTAAPAYHAQPAYQQAYHAQPAYHTQQAYHAQPTAYIAQPKVAIAQPVAYGKKKVFFVK